MTNIILCGGSGTRLWPISRTLMPKQFVKLFEDKSLFQLTVERNSAVCDQQLIVSNSEQYFLAFNQLEEINQANNSYILEPVGRNTAPAIALACMSLDPDEIVLVTPSDHLIKDQHAYVHVITQAAKLASDDYLVTFGITPTFPETGFGYIEASGQDVKAFHEKPNLKTAELYVNSRNYYWNSGMFCFRAGLFLDELQKWSPAIFDASAQAYTNAVHGEMIKISYEDMNAIPDKSIDYAVMEKSNRVKVIPSSIGWSDVGSFDALSDVMPNDENNNFILSNKPVNLIDVKDLIIIDTEDALLISHKGSSQKVKEVVQHYKQINPNLTHIHRTAHRPWGTYTVLEDTPGYKIKRIMVKPGKRLSLQKHFHRNEHWIVLSGTATVTVGEKTFSVHPNESTYIKAGEVHRLANLGKIPLTIIETQVGEYTGEDDIVRIEDDFNREGNE
ncbi:MAG: mannose-1-phosphate guanylyltransferase/mannose-6-phosphate isomerase [Sulfuricurvum sp.]|uniref:mannose-1-phosphate guanylyltransferase/mannose-6-phosphate isomerase n=1 Tax=Sulfuricurvum sp. TaxID=2025608 RepID=UPI00271AC339|nr:mannose-1-phosphate guanylyltransferase/mannose-6-phosphate isomerase [Sulfuricurvum sp.]MDO9055882.1 mannose-1-phosphate guanylyltransferase/mannose-6-phosphate isomerase [Sulfuricurvum sp.]